jgi:two-component system cell cycle response regulator DivK
MDQPILLIEDNAQNRYLTTYLLEQHGYHIVSAADGESGITAAVECNPVMILLDIQLPLMDGYEVARSLRRLPQLTTTPIVAVTSYAMPVDRERALEAGCSGYIEKPIDPDTFLFLLQGFGLPAARDRSP